MLTEEQCEGLRLRIQSYRDCCRLPSEEELVSLLDRTVSTLENESSSYRSKATEGSAGGLLDFSYDNLPVVIVPDLNGRPDFLIQLMLCSFE